MIVKSIANKAFCLSVSYSALIRNPMVKMEVYYTCVLVSSTSWESSQNIKENNSKALFKYYNTGLLEAEMY